MNGLEKVVPPGGIRFPRLDTPIHGPDFGACDAGSRSDFPSSSKISSPPEGPPGRPKQRHSHDHPEQNESPRLKLRAPIPVWMFQPDLGLFQRRPILPRHQRVGGDINALPLLEHRRTLDPHSHVSHPGLTTDLRLQILQRTPSGEALHCGISLTRCTVA